MDLLVTVSTKIVCHLPVSIFLLLFMQEFVMSIVCPVMKNIMYDLKCKGIKKFLLKCISYSCILFCFLVLFIQLNCFIVVFHLLPIVNNAFSFLQLKRAY